jgi:hypothetical protein
LRNDVADGYVNAEAAAKVYGKYLASFDFATHPPEHRGLCETKSALFVPCRKPMRRHRYLYF